MVRNGSQPTRDSRPLGVSRWPAVTVSRFCSIQGPMSCSRPCSSTSLMTGVVLIKLHSCAFFSMRRIVRRALFVLAGLGLSLLFLDLGLQLRLFFLAVHLRFLDVVLLLLELLIVFFLLLGRGHGRLFDVIVGVRRRLGGVWRGGGRRSRLGWGAGRVGAPFLALIDFAIVARV